MTPEYEEKFVRACLAVLVRRAGFPLVISFAEIEGEYERRCEVACSVDAEAKCVRISVPEVPA